MDVPPAFEDLAKTRGTGVEGAIPSDTVILFAIGKQIFTIKFIYSKKATKFCEISTLLLFYLVPVKSKMNISQNFVALSKYIKFKTG